MSKTTTQPQILLRRPEVSKRIGLSRSTIYLMVSKGEFPKPVRIGRRAVAWREIDVLDWVRACVEV